MENATPPPNSLLSERLDHRGADVVVLTMNRPAQKNPLDKLTVAALAAELERLAGDGPPDVVVLTGAGDAFSAGGDLRGYQELYRDRPAFDAFLRDFAALNALLESGPFLSIAMINGTCVAGGLEISLACDLITIADGAQIGDGHIRFGQLPGAGGSQRLVRAIGFQRAKQWLYTGQLFAADEAVAAGLGIFSAPADDLRQATLDLVAQLATHSPIARRTMKELVTVARTTPLVDGLEIERETVIEYATSSHDATEGLLAFVERRPPKYLGR
jgi:enoyl-CoA hydratase/carnithine racemase